ncbi:MAG: DUF4249 family protein [Bacteroidota bacterium]
MHILLTYWIRLVLALLLFFSACEQYVDWELEAAEEEHIVVEAILTDEFIRQEILLSRTFTDINQSPPALLDARVQVEVNGVKYEFSPDDREPGRYVSNEPFRVLGDLDYRLKIEWQGKIFTANSELSFVAPIPEFTFEKQADTTQLSFSQYLGTYNPNQQALYEMKLDWTDIIPGDSSRALFYYYTFSSVHIGQLIVPRRERIIFPRGTKVYIKKFGLNEDFAAFLRAKALETEWQGNFFYGPRENVPTNLSKGALGFFSTCAVLRDSLIAE